MCYDPLRVVEELEGDAKEERDVRREVRAQDEGEAMDIDKSDNKHTGADAEDEEMASQEEQHNEGGVRERIPVTPTPVASAPASTYTPYRYQPDDKKRKAARPAHADSDVLAFPFPAPWFRSHTTCPTCRFASESLTLRMLPPMRLVGRGGARPRECAECGETAFVRKFV